jgi:hypothetical protein
MSQAPLHKKINDLNPLFISATRTDFTALTPACYMQHAVHDGDVGHRVRMFHQSEKQSMEAKASELYRLV